VRWRCAPRTGPVAIEIVDVAGRSVRRAQLADAGSSARIWLWDGLDDAGRRVPAGYYRVRAVGASGGMSRPIVRIETGRAGPGPEKARRPGGQPDGMPSKCLRDSSRGATGSRGFPSLPPDPGRARER
jgi:hypothetical protein